MVAFSSVKSLWGEEVVQTNDIGRCFWFRGIKEGE